MGLIRVSSVALEAELAFASSQGMETSRRPLDQSPQGRAPATLGCHVLLSHGEKYINSSLSR